ncbi:ArsR family transcriptional regulator [Oerskovia turbata]|uniref:ArsR family transcriptional regulator n=1 Tax=Oerskovia turbata TaxID=1713 RepID=A0A4V1N5D1_9CELL|nr:helix-turn-helix domain-containing protein [Oerskovia turbata]RXR25100.1 ArsR family transcriptional regulator [Oerskovia turbata]RXR35246.1 ArsR family transcriptional regulator [Oerskovia turbata]TGJ95276.1 ArsR family transcriptional regulator [Actinotalea fermentans ATCC 43279 = JCM 9966 = DSM 3133]
MRETFHVQDPAALRAIAHPMRQRILSELVVLGHARAADLAQAIGEPANSISFHLRVLAKAGMIVEAPEHARDRRDRVWTNAAESYVVDPGSPGVVREVVRPALRWAERLFVEANDTSSHDKDRLFAISALVLTPQQAEEMAKEVTDLLERWADRALTEARKAPDPDRRAYQALAVLAPRGSDGSDDTP